MGRLAAIAALACATVCCARSPDSSGQPRKDTKPEAPRAVTPEQVEPVGIEMRNVRLHPAPGVVLDVARLRGRLVATKGSLPVFDDQQSFHLDVEGAALSLDASSVTALVNHVFAYRGLPPERPEGRIRGRPDRATRKAPKGNTDSVHRRGDRGARRRRRPASSGQSPCGGNPVDEGDGLLRHRARRPHPCARRPGNQDPRQRSVSRAVAHALRTRGPWTRLGRPRRRRPALARPWQRRPNLERPTRRRRVPKATSSGSAAAASASAG